MIRQKHNFQSYTKTLHRVQLAEFLDQHTQKLRLAKLRPSLVVNPITGLHYGDPTGTKDKARTA